MILPPQGRVRLATRMNRIAPFHVMALLERAQELERQGRDVIHLGVGEPDFPTPEPIRQAGLQALQQGLTRYTPAAGLPALRQALSAYYRDFLNAEVAPERILITPGASGALQLALAALVDPGAGVLVADPGYPCNRHFIELVNGEPQAMALSAEGRITADILRQHWRPNTVAALLASPDNPTGTVYEAAELLALQQTVEQQGGVLLLDEIYQGLNYEVPVHTLLAQTDRCFVINSFSKFFGMTGWRLGWLVVPPEFSADIDKLAQNFFIAAPTPSQHAALAAFTAQAAAERERRRQVLAQRRALLLEQLPALGLRVVGRPQGAFYLYLDASALTDDSEQFCRQLLEQEAVVLTPGLDFGEQHGPARHLRLAYTVGEERILEALMRIRRFIGQQHHAV